MQAARPANPQTYPICRIVADNGTVLDDPTLTKVEVESVVTAEGTPVADHGVVVVRAGADVSVVYDAVGKGDAYIRLKVTSDDEGIGLTSVNAAAVYYATGDARQMTDGAAIVQAFGDAMAATVERLKDATDRLERARESIASFGWLILALTDQATIKSGTRKEVTVSGLTLPLSDLSTMRAWLINDDLAPVGCRPISRVVPGPKGTDLVVLQFADPGFSRAPTPSDRIVVTR